MAVLDPMEKSHKVAPPSVSKKTFVIAGILTTVFGLDEIPPDIKDVTTLWLLHPRGQSQARMELTAFSAITTWNQNLAQRNDRGPPPGLIAVSFDQRNHGSREVEKIANEAWKSGNEKHAQDMFSIYQGTALDTSQLITYLPAYAFPTSSHTVVDNIVLGVSLGGHSAWQCIFHDPRITSAIVVIGCPDFVSLMSDRARLSKRQSWSTTSPPGATFLGSTDFPKNLIEAVETYDPAGLLMGEISNRNSETYEREPSDKEKTRLMPLMKSTLQGKRILLLSGGKDKLVPYKCGEPFVKWLKRAIAPDGWFKDNGVVLEDIVFDGVGHEFSSGMLQEAIRFILQSQSSSGTTNATSML